MSQLLYKRSDKAIFDDLGGDGDVVALLISTGRCFGMENVTATIWALLAEPSDVEHLCAQLVQQYDVDADLCRHEVAAIIEEMIDEGLVEQVN